MNWTDSITGYLEHLKFERGLSDNTISAYKRDLNQLANFSDLKPKLITAKHISAYLQHLHSIGDSPRALVRVLSALRGFFNWMIDEELLSEHPVVLFENPKTGRKLPVVLSVQEVDRLLEAIRMNEDFATRDRAIIELLYACGLRVSEACTLKRSLLRLEEGYIIVTGKGYKQR